MTTKKEVYKYSHKPRNIFRTLLATWRVLKDPYDLDANVKEAAIVEIYFNRSKFGRKIAKWDVTAQELKETQPLAAEAMTARRRLGYIHLDEMAKCPEGSFGHTFAALANKRGIDPNLLEPIPSTDDGEWFMGHMYETHDFWHVISGHNFDMEGEFGTSGFYMAQVKNFSFFAFFLSILVLQHVWGKREDISKITEAFVNGYQIGKQAKCIVGLDWESIYDKDIEEVRAEFGIVHAGHLPDLKIAA